MAYGTTFLLDSNGDLQFNALNRATLTSTDAEKAKQDAIITLKTIFTEDIFNPDAGFDLLKIKQYPYNKQLIEAEIRSALKKYKYLKSIDKVEVGQPGADRVVPVSVQITTTNDISLSIGVSI